MPLIKGLLRYDDAITTTKFAEVNPKNKSYSSRENIRSSAFTKTPFYNDAGLPTTEIIRAGLSSSVHRSLTKNPKLSSIAAKMNETVLKNSFVNESLASEIRRPCIDFNPCKHGSCQINNKTKEFM